MDKIQEIWKDVVGYEGIYQVSDQGRVKNVVRRTRTKPGKILSATPDTWGYLKLLLAKDGYSQPRRIHRIVAEAFHPNPHNKPTVNHKDRNKRNNRADNLEWATQKEQNVHRVKTKDLYISIIQ